jgi:hypothetical protein
VSTAPDIRRVAAGNYEGFDLGPWAAYLAAFDRYLASGDLEARLTMRVELQDRLDERGMVLPENRPGMNACGDVPNTYGVVVGA